MEEEKSCKKLVGRHLKGRIYAIRKLWTLYKEDPELNDEKYGNFNEYGLCFDYVPPETFIDQKEGYFRYQLSWGGPSDEFRFFVGPEFIPYQIEYWYMDWFDGARRVLKDEALNLMMEIFKDFKECGTVEHAFKQA